MRLLHRFIPFLFAFAALTAPAVSSAQVSVGLSITLAPPALPVYVQPPLPTPGFIWTPGYWAYGPNGYYWVPGTWVEPPAVGLLWTPGYWGWAGGIYAFHAGYWGPHVGFYGGINYGFGYTGVGFAGGLWDHGVFSYNRSVTNVTNVTNVRVFNRAVVVPPGAGRVSFNGGTGGIRAVPTAEERAAEQEHHVAPTSLQAQHEHAAAGNRALLASVNHNRPPIAATSRPGEFKGAGVVAARPAGAPKRAAVRPAGEAAHPPAGQPQHPVARTPAERTPAAAHAPVEHAPAERKAPPAEEKGEHQQ